MSIPAEAYEVEEADFSEDFETFDEARRRPARRISVPGAGLMSAILQTPKGPARLNLPAALPTIVQFRALEQALNAQGQRINTVTAELVRVRRELALRRQQQGMGSSGFLFPLLMMKKVREDLEGHTHPVANGPAVLPTSSGGLSGILPLLLLAPGIFGGSPATSANSGGGMDGMQPLLMAFVFSEFL